MGIEFVSGVSKYQRRVWAGAGAAGLTIVVLVAVIATGGSQEAAVSYDKNGKLASASPTPTPTPTPTTTCGGCTDLGIACMACHMKITQIEFCAKRPTYNGCSGATPPPPAKGLCAAINCGAHGACVPSTGACRCSGGWLGGLCDVNPCTNVNCGSYGKCTMGKCTCQSGWTGTSCGVSSATPPPPPTKTGPCAGVSCGANGVCRKKTSSYGKAGACRCTSGYKGAKCTVSPCANVNCGKYGTCYIGKCTCSAGWRGTNCQTNGNKPAAGIKCSTTQVASVIATYTKEAGVTEAARLTNWLTSKTGGRGRRQLAGQRGGRDNKKGGKRKMSAALTACVKKCTGSWKQKRPCYQKCRKANKATGTNGLNIKVFCGAKQTIAQLKALIASKVCAVPKAVGRLINSNCKNNVVANVIGGGKCGQFFINSKYLKSAVAFAKAKGWKASTGTCARKGYGKKGKKTTLKAATTGYTNTNVVVTFYTKGSKKKGCTKAQLSALSKKCPKSTARYFGGRGGGGRRQLQRDRGGKGRTRPNPAMDVCKSSTCSAAVNAASCKVSGRVKSLMNAAKAMKARNCAVLKPCTAAQLTATSGSCPASAKRYFKAQGGRGGRGRRQLQKGGNKKGGNKKGGNKKGGLTGAAQKQYRACRTACKAKKCKRKACRTCYQACYKAAAATKPGTSKPSPTPSATSATSATLAMCKSAKCMKSITALGKKCKLPNNLGRQARTVKAAQNRRCQGIKGGKGGKGTCKDRAGTTRCAGFLTHMKTLCTSKRTARYCQKTCKKC